MRMGVEVVACDADNAPAIQVAQPINNIARQQRQHAASSKVKPNHIYSGRSIYANL